MKQKSLPAKQRFRLLLLLAALLMTTFAELHWRTAAHENARASTVSYANPAQGKAKSIRPYSSTPSKDAIKWADKQLKRMSLDEKIGQLISVGVNATFLNQDSDAFRSLRHQVVDNHVGGIILFKGPVYESVVLVNRMQELAKY